MRLNLRTASWIVGASAVVLPVAFVAERQHAFNQWADQRAGVCGMPLLGIWFMGLAALLLLSAIAMAMNGIDLRRANAPRPVWRCAEFSLLALPTAVGIVSLAAAVVL